MSWLDKDLVNEADASDMQRQAAPIINQVTQARAADQQQATDPAATSQSGRFDLSSLPGLLSTWTDQPSQPAQNLNTTVDVSNPSTEPQPVKQSDGGFDLGGLVSRLTSVWSDEPTSSDQGNGIAAPWAQPRPPQQQPAQGGAALATPAAMPMAPPPRSQTGPYNISYEDGRQQQAAGPIAGGNRDDFLRTAGPIAAQVEQQTGIPAKLTLAVAANETGWGDPQYVIGNNYHGIHAQGGEPSIQSTDHDAEGRQYTVGYRRFDSPAAGFQGFADFLLNNPRYAPALAKYRQSGDVNQLASDITAAGYAEDPNYASKIQAIMAGIPDVSSSAQAAPATARQVPTSPSQAAPGGTSEAMPSSSGSLRPSQFDPELTREQAIAACGLAGAVGFAAAMKRYPTVKEAENIAENRGLWDQGQGMHGPASEVALLKEMGVAAKMEPTVDWAKVRRDVQSGNPVMFDTNAGSAGHYYFVEGTRQRSDGQWEYDLGTSSMDLRAAQGRRWFTADEIPSLGFGAPANAIYLDNPETPRQSPVAGKSKPDPENPVIQMVTGAAQNSQSDTQSNTNPTASPSSGQPPVDSNSMRNTQQSTPLAAPFQDSQAEPVGQPTTMYRQSLEPSIDPGQDGGEGPSTFWTARKPAPDNPLVPLNRQGEPIPQRLNPIPEGAPNQAVPGNVDEWQAPDVPVPPESPDGRNRAVPGWVDESQGPPATRGPQTVPLSSSSDSGGAFQDDATDSGHTQLPPRPGTLVPIQNPDGSVSTELSITVTEPGLNSGRPTNIPTVWDGQRVSDDEAIDNAIRSGVAFPSFNSIKQAEQAARKRSHDLGAGELTSVGGASVPPSVIGTGPNLSPDVVNATTSTTRNLIDNLTGQNDQVSYRQSLLPTDPEASTGDSGATFDGSDATSDGSGPTFQDDQTEAGHNPSPSQQLQPVDTSGPTEGPPAPETSRFEPLAGQQPAQPGELPERPTTPSESPMKPLYDLGGQLVGYVQAGAEAAGNAIGQADQQLESTLNAAHLPNAPGALRAAGNYIAENNFPVWSQRTLGRMQEIDKQAADWITAHGGQSNGLNDASNNTEWRAAHRELAAEYDDLNRDVMLTLGGMVGAGGAGHGGGEVARRLAQEETPIGRAIGQGARNVADAIGEKAQNVSDAIAERVGRLPSGQPAPEALPPGTVLHVPTPEGEPNAGLRILNPTGQPFAADEVQQITSSLEQRGITAHPSADGTMLVVPATEGVPASFVTDVATATREAGYDPAEAVAAYHGETRPVEAPGATSDQSVGAGPTQDRGGAAERPGVQPGADTSATAAGSATSSGPEGARPGATAAVDVPNGPADAAPPGASAGDIRPEGQPGGGDVAPTRQAIDDAHAALDNLESQGIDVSQARAALPERPASDSGAPPPREPPTATGATSEPPPDNQGRIPGMGYHDTSGTSPEAAGLVRGARAGYEANDLTTVHQADVARRAEQVLGLEPGTVERWQNEQHAAGTTTEAVKGDALRQAAYGDAEAVVQAQRRFDAVHQEIADHINSGGTPETLPEDVKQRAAEAAVDLADLQARFAPSAQASTAHGTAMARALNQRKNLISGRSAFQLAEQGRQLADDARQAAEAAQKAAEVGAIDEGTKRALRTVRDRLGKSVDEGQLAREADIQERLGTVERSAENARQQVRQKRGEPGQSPQPESSRGEPKAETLAERLGRLKREHGAAEDAGDTAAATSKQAEIDGTLEEIRLRAAERAQKIANETKAPLTPEEAQRAVDEAIGRRTVSKINAQAMAEAKGRSQGEFLSQFDKDIGKKVDQALAKDARLQAQAQVNDLAKQARDWHQRSLGDPANEAFRREEAASLERLRQHSTVGATTADDLAERFGANRAEAADTFRGDMERRIAEAEKQRTAASAQQDLKALHAEAKTWLQRTTKEPDNPHIEEQFQQAAERLASHSQKGGELALDLGNKLADAKSEASLKFHGDVEKRIADDARRQVATEQKALEASRIRGVMGQIDEVLKSPDAPGAMDRLRELHADLTDISLAGFDKSSKLRERLYRQNLLRAGMSKDTGDLDALVKGLARVDPNDPTTIRPVLAAIQRPTLWGVLRELQYVNMLSSPVTHGVNAAANGLQIAGRLFLNNPLEFIGSGGASTGTGAAIQGSAKGLAHGVELARAVMRTGINPDAVERAIEMGQVNGIGRELLTEKFGKLGVAMHAVSTRPLEAMDAMLGHVAYAGAAEQYAQQTADRLLARGAAEVKGLDRVAARQYVMDHIWDYPEVVQRAGKIQDYTLLKSRDVGESGWGRVERQLRSVAGLRAVPENPTAADYLVSGLVDFIAPFFNVPLNYAKQGAERTFGALIYTAKWAKALANGDRQAAGEHFAKAAIGAATMASAVGLVASDNLTGDGPSDPSQRQVWLEDHQPNSWRVPGTKTWHTWQGTPWGIPFATVAGASEAYNEAQASGDKKGLPDAETVLKAGAGAYRGAVQGFLSQSFMQGIAQQYQFLTGQDTGLGAVSANAASAVSRYTPIIGSSLLAFLARVTDGMERDAGKPLSVSDLPQNVAARVATRLPGLREQIDPRLGAYGEPVRNQAAGPLGALPYYRGPAPMEGDAITSRLEDAGVGAPLAPTEISVGSGGAKVALTMAERRLYQQEAGQTYRQLLEAAGPEVSPVAMNRLRDRARNVAQARVVESIGADMSKRLRLPETAVR
jgi:flagellum-specific peptidoglycan hydrolase FlgJ